MNSAIVEAGKKRAGLVDRPLVGPFHITGIADDFGGSPVYAGEPQASLEEAIEVGLSYSDTLLNVLIHDRKGLVWCWTNL